MSIHLTINNRRIGPGYPPFIVAEVSANHHGSLDMAIAILDAAKKAGADAVKLQTYTPDTITLNSRSDEFMIHSGLWEGRSLYELYSEAYLPWDWHRPIYEHANKIGLTIFSSPFDFTAVDLLESLDSPAYKIASFEAIDLPLIRYVARTGKPVIISTGMANEFEIREAVEAAKGAGCKELALLHCVSSYPADPSEYNLRTIPKIRDLFDVVVGLSDHTVDNATAVASIALGANIIEKHFTLDKDGGGADDSFSLEPLELEALCRDAQTAFLSLGAPTVGATNSERENIKFRRSLYFVKDIRRGETITADSIRSVRPGFGMAPKYYDQIIGKKAALDVTMNTPVLKEAVQWGSEEVQELT